MHYSLIVPAWNEAAYISPTLEAAKQSMELIQGHSGELVVVDNNSTDETAEIAHAAGVTVVFESVNRIANARNCGARHTAGSALVFLDADTTLSAALLQQALDNLASGLIVGGGAMVAPDKPTVVAARRGMKVWNRISSVFGLAAGCFVYCRRDAFEDVGGFDERVYAGEELHLSRRLKRWGKRRNMRFGIISQPQIVTSVRKLEWYSTSQLIRQMVLVMLPGALYSKKLCGTWYDTRRARD